MSIENTPARRRRRTPEEAKREALVSARKLLLSGGPDAVTLAAVCVHRGLGWGWSAAVVAAVITIRGAWRLYRRRLWLSWLQDLPRSAASTSLAFALLSGIGLVGGSDAADLAAAQWAMIVFALVIEPVRWCVFAFGRWCRRKFDRCDRTIIVGAGEVGVNLARTMLEHPQFGLRPVAFM